MHPPKLEGKTAVVTGAGSGIGRATAQAFAAAGARVALCDIDEARVHAVAAELGDRALLAQRVDVSDRAQMRAFADAVHALVPGVDVVVNNAGVAVGGTFLDTTLDDWDWLLGVNLRGVVHGCHFFLPKMVERGAGGQVINLSSILGIFPAPGVSAYVASKFAVLGMSQTLRAELAPHRIGVSAICPGLIATQIVADGRMQGGVGSRKTSVVDVFAKRGLSPTKVADAILDSVRTNPAIRTVGYDGWALAAAHRIAPELTQRIAASVSRRMGMD
jgi:NAD(P)-dependent dehydrogenase (short-subunit alcohol dehydrogenase family)